MHPKASSDGCHLQEQLIQQEKLEPVMLKVHSSRFRSFALKIPSTDSSQIQINNNPMKESD